MHSFYLINIRLLLSCGSLFYCFFNLFSHFLNYFVKKCTLYYNKPYLCFIINQIKYLVMTTFNLELKKALNPATVKQIKFAQSLAEKTNSILPNTSQMMKYCEMDTMSDVIDAMKEGKTIELS